MFGSKGGKASAPTSKPRVDSSTAGGLRPAGQPGEVKVGKPTGGTGANNKLPK